MLLELHNHRSEAKIRDTRESASLYFLFSISESGRLLYVKVSKVFSLFGRFTVQRACFPFLIFFLRCASSANDQLQIKEIKILFYLENFPKTYDVSSRQLSMHTLSTSKKVSTLYTAKNCGDS